MLPDDDEIARGTGSGFADTLSSSRRTRRRDEFTRCRLRQRYVGCYVQSTIHGNVFVFPAAGDQDIFGPLLRLFAFRIPQGVFSLLPRRVPPHVSTAHSFINPKPCRPLRPHTGVYVRTVRSKDGICMWAG